MVTLRSEPRAVICTLCANKALNSLFAMPRHNHMHFAVVNLLLRLPDAFATHKWHNCNNSDIVGDRGLTAITVLSLVTGD